MKEFKYKGKTYQYEVTDRNGYGYVYTKIYTIKTETYKKFKFFGKILKRNVPNLLFKLPVNFEDPTQNKKNIKQQLDYQFKLIKRAEEIKQGKIL